MHCINLLLDISPIRDSGFCVAATLATRIHRKIRIGSYKWGLVPLFNTYFTLILVFWWFRYDKLWRIDLFIKKSCATICSTVVSNCGISLSPVVRENYSNYIRRRITVQVEILICIQWALRSHRWEQDRMTVQLDIFISWVAIHSCASFVRCQLIVVIDPRFRRQLVWRSRIAIVSATMTLISSLSHHLHNAPSLALQYRLILHGYRLPWAGYKWSALYICLPLRVSVHYHHLLLIFLPHTLQPLAYNFSHVRLLTAQVLVVQKGGPIEKVHCLGVIVEVLMLHAQVIQSDDHCSEYVFLVSTELKFVTDGVLVDKIWTTVAINHRKLVFKLMQNLFSSTKATLSISNCFFVLL